MKSLKPSPHLRRWNHLLLFALFSCPLSLFFSANSWAERDFDQQKMQQYITDLAKHNKAMLSVVISEKGKVRFRQQTANRGEKNNFNRPYKIGSITKTFTSTLVFQLIEQGELSLNTPLATFYPTIPNADSITIEHMLSHRSGIHNYIDNQDFLSYYSSEQSEAAMVARIQSYPSEFSPNYQFQYSNANYLLLGYIIEKVTGKPYEQILKSHITDKLGLTATKLCRDLAACGFNTLSYYYSNYQWLPYNEWSPSVALGAGAMISTPTELSRFIRALFNGKLVSADSLKSMKSYSNQFSKGVFNYPIYYLSGYGHDGWIEGFHSRLVYFEQEDVSIAIHSNALNSNFNDITVNLFGLYMGMSIELPTLHRTSIDITQNELKPYQGNFSSNSSEFTITLYIKDGQLMGQAMGQDAIPLTPLSNHEFESQAYGILLEFDKNTDHQEFTLHWGNFSYRYHKI